MPETPLDSEEQRPNAEGPEPTDEEKELAATPRQQEEEGMRGSNDEG